MAKDFDDPVGCFWDLGCKGPITLSACAKTRWNSGTGFCTLQGPMCYGCMHPSFPDPPTSGFFSPSEQVPTLLGLTVDNVAEVVIPGGAGVLAVHAARRSLSKKKEPETAEAKPPSPESPPEAKP